MNKVMDAPEKIYLQVCGDCQQTDCDACKFEDLEDNVTWCKDHIFPKDVEYTRTDSFIERVCEWLSKFCSETCNLSSSYTCRVINDLRKTLEE